MSHRFDIGKVNPHTDDNLKTGWVRLYRSWLQSLIWTMPASWTKLALACLLLANKKPSKWWNGNESIPIPAGSFTTSIRKLARAAEINAVNVLQSKD